MSHEPRALLGKGAVIVYDLLTQVHDRNLAEIVRLRIRSERKGVYPWVSYFKSRTKSR